MGTNPHAKNANLTGVFLDSDGNVDIIVHADNDDFGPHAYPGLVNIAVPFQTYAAAPAVNVGGKASYHALSAAILPLIADSKLATAVQTKIDTALAAVAAKEQAAQDAAKKWEDFRAVLSPAQSAALDSVKTMNDLSAFIETLNPAQRLAAPFSTAAVVP